MNEITIDFIVRIRFKRLLIAINYVLLSLGRKPWVHPWFIAVHTKKVIL